MNGVAALLDAASDGVDFDGLVVENGTYGYRFETPDTSARGIDTGELASLADGDPYVENWRHWRETVGGEGTARRAFLRWIEGAPDATGDATDADGTDGGASDATDRDDAVPEPKARLDDLRGDGRTRTWGELRVRVRVDDAGGARVYDLRHVDDVDADPRSLETHRDPTDARRIAKYDDSGRYRPLSTAPTLRRGWRFADLDGAALVDTVEFCYPATVENWHRERTGALDVTHWRETADRQTGIYADVTALPDDAVAWAAEACCTDATCLKRREWDRDADDELDVPRGDGAFPCREPCSLFVAAAREFARLEEESETTYELRVTPSERDALADLVDAVADGRLDDVREADLGDGANRYRARYLRAKRPDLFD